MRKKYLRHILFLMLLYCVIPAFVQGQNAYNSEADLKKQAAKIFDKEDYTAAYPLYSQLLSLYPKNGDYNYKFGVCILLSTGDKEKPIPYLEYASNQPDVDKDVFYYLAKAYHLNYRFDDAIAMYQKYKTVGSKSQIEKFQIDRQIAMCQNGKALLKNIKGLDVIDKKELTIDDYYLSYSLPDIGGKLLVEPDDFKTSLDKKKNVSSIIFLSNNHNQIYYSSYGKDGKNGKDIYVIKKLPNGEWSKPENVGAPINTEYDEDFPFLHPDGKELYFCSKGHNSMGGYDIFKSIWNDTTKTWGEPVNLDFPINTPADDILYITDTDDKMAYFSSDRSSPNGKIMIYKINVARKPVDISIIKGDFVKTDDKQNIDSKITVQNMENNEIVGIFKVSETSGDYIMNLPNGGKFLFTVETNGFSTQSSMVSIPVQYELKPLKQEITYEKGTGKLIIKNMFDQPVDDNNYLLAMNYIKQRAKMEVNASSDSSSSKNNSLNNAVVQNNNSNKTLASNQNSNKPLLKDSLDTNDYNASNDSTESTDNATNDSTSTANNSTSDSSKTNQPNLSNADIVKIAYNDANESDKEAKDMQNQANAALAMANEKNEETKDKNAETDQLKAKADQIQDPTQKQSILDQYNESKKEANKLANATVAAFNIATQLQSDATAKRKEADFSQEYAKQLDNAVSSNSSNSDAALKQMASEKDSLDKMNQKPVGTDNVYNNLKTDVDNKQAEADDANQKLTNNKQQLANLNGNISQMQAQADTSSNQTLKQALQSQVSELKTERTQKQNDIASETKKAAELQEEASNLKDQLAVSNGMITQIKQGANNPANADVSSIDKQKLQQEVASYKQVNVADSSSLAQSSNATNSTLTSTSSNQQNNNSNNSTVSNSASDSLNNNSSVSDSTENVANNVTNNAQTNVSDSAANTTNYADKYSNAITEAEKITDDYNRDEAEAAIYSDWANAIKNDISDKQNNLASITNKKDKKAAEKAIAGLQKDFNAKQLLSQQDTQNADTIKQSLASVKNNFANDSTNTNNNSQNGNTNLASNSTTSNSGNNNSTNSANTQNNPQNGNTTTTGNANLASNSTTSNSGNNNSTNSANTQNNSQNGNTTTTGNANLASNSTTSNSVNNNPSKSANSQNNSQNGNTTTTGNTNLASNSTTSNSGNNNSTDSTNTQTDSQNGNTTTTGNANLASNSTTFNSGNNASDLTVSSDKLYSSADAKNNNKQAEQSEQQAQTANDKHDSLMQQAASEKDTAQKVQLMADANAAQLQAQQAQIKAADAYAKADKIQNQKNNQEIAQLSQATASQNADDLLIASAMNDDATTHFKNAQKDRDLAAQSLDPIEKQALQKQAHDEENTALIKQQKAIAIYSKYAPQVASQFNQQSQNQNANQTSASQNNNLTNSQNNNTVANNTQQSNTTENGSVTNPQTNTTNSNTATANNQQIKNTPEFQKYVTTINQSDSLEAIANNNFKTSDNYKKLSESEADSASKNRAAADTISDSGQKQDALTEAQTEVLLATTNKNKSDSLTALANQNQSAAISKKADAATYLSSLDTQTASNIKAASKESNNNQNITANTTNANSGNAATGTQNTNGNNTNAANNVAINSQQNASQTNSNNNQTGTNNLAANSNTANTINTSTDNSTVNNTNNTSTNTTTISLTDTFEASQTPVYTAESPIPINPPLPNGVYFKVQVGAFRNKIPQDLFKGMKPVIGETTPQGFIRYSAGMFTATNKANDAKNKIVAMGYKDAFVVAFINGKRVSMDKALASLNQPQTANNNNQNATATNSQNNIAENASNTAVSTDVVQVKGLFYTVQVGVYLRPEPASKLFNIQPLYSEKTANGFIRYNSGIFNDFDKATAAKNIIVNIGIKDAFVTAYYNGKRIDPDKAKALITAGSAQYTSDANVNEMPSQNNQANVQTQQQTENQTSVVTQPNTNSVTQTTTPTNPQSTNNSTSGTTTSDNKVVFKVQIGAYKNQIPLEIANKFLTLGGNGVKTYVDENGITIYTTGSFAAFNDAEQLKNKIVSEGIPDAFVTAFNNGKKITLDEAQKLIH